MGNDMQRSKSFQTFDEVKTTNHLVKHFLYLKDPFLNFSHRGALAGDVPIDLLFHSWSHSWREEARYYTTPL